MAGGEQTAATQLDAPTTVVSWFYLAAVDVLTQGRFPVIAAIGDSITDGDQISTMEPVDENARYTDFLAKKLLRQGRAAVVNLGISGNQITTTFIGENLPARLNRDVLTQTGVTHVIVQGGINDIRLPGLLTAIGIPTPGNDAASIIAGHQQIAARIRAAGLKVIGTTLSPLARLVCLAIQVKKLKRSEVKLIIGFVPAVAYDLVVDFDEALADPNDPTVMRADLSADGLHPNSEGYRAMARAREACVATSRRAVACASCSEVAPSGATSYCATACER